MSLSSAVATRERSPNRLRHWSRHANVRRVGGADAVLAARLVAGDDDALAEIFDRFAAVVHAAARRGLGNTPAAEDVVQDVFFTLWQRPARFDPNRGSMRAFLTTLANRRAIDVVRSDVRRAGREALRERLVPEQRGHTDEIDAQIVAGVVREAVRMLPGEQRKVVELAYFQGLSYRDVAATVGIPEGTAKSRLRLALARLEAALDPQLLETS